MGLKQLNVIRMKLLFICVSCLVTSTILTFLYTQTTCISDLKKMSHFENEVKQISTSAVSIPNPTLLAGKQRGYKVNLTIGIPTVNRKKTMYLFDTIQSLINESTARDRNNMTVVVLFCDLDNQFNGQLLNRIRTRFNAELTSGFLLVIRAPTENYPSLQNLRRTFGDSSDRVMWRSKQNLDYAVLMAYAQNISRYYLQLEDDVIAAPSYYGKIMSFVDSISEEWAMLDFSTLGFIGKLYQCKDLMKLAVLLRTFFSEQPCDFLLNFHLNLMLQNKRYIRTPTLFKHIGSISSLSNTKRNNKNLFFQGRTKIHKGDNPEAEVYTNMIVYNDHVVENAYNSKRDDSAFWAKAPKINDFVELIFKRPANISRIIVETGFSADYQHDQLESARLDAGYNLINVTHFKRQCTKFHTLGIFTKGRIDVIISQNSGVISCLLITVTQTQLNWLYMPEIAVFTHELDKT